MREVFLCVERGSQVSVVFPDAVCHHGAEEIFKAKFMSSFSSIIVIILDLALMDKINNYLLHITMW
jgi:hypothetical protein